MNIYAICKNVKLDCLEINFNNTSICVVTIYFYNKKKIQLLKEIVGLCELVAEAGLEPATFRL